jgi:CheY-like chemotaxis protein
MDWNPEEAPMRSESGSIRPITILMADDDEEDRDLARDALEGTRLGDRMEFVTDGQDLIDYLRHQGPYADAATPRPSIILLDLNMPRKDGREALAELKADESLRQIPVVILTTSSDEVDVQNAYDLGASSYITKPVTHGKLVDVMQTVARYWSEVVELPDTTAL